MFKIKPQGKQYEVLALPANGHIVVLGTAGSGKTTIALLRASCEYIEWWKSIACYI